MVTKNRLLMCAIKVVSYKLGTYKMRTKNLQNSFRQKIAIFIQR